MSPSVIESLRYGDSSRGKVIPYMLAAMADASLFQGVELVALRQEAPWATPPRPV